MSDLAKQREEMIVEQLEGRGIRDPELLSVMGKIEREIFVPEAYKDRAYNDSPLPIESGQTISQPYIVALMIEVLNLNKEDVVLEIGTGSGYQTVILAELIKEVYTIERKEELYNKSMERFKALGYKNIYSYLGDGTLGLPVSSLLFDKIIVSAAAEEVGRPLLDALAVGGSLVAPIGSFSYQSLFKYTKKEKGLKKEKITDCVFVPLIGQYGLKE